ncbi:MAG: hypothetical protein A3J74_09710 [Elusimicrobia bacterium RIFCSPHIGHO2_02_FULL_57_9]|nr:MAG: hypothetical protein A3J74_09710 [Elusimicrobia bacterium RIFCSPHIGHO2_02_FULL_57_9]
MNAKTITLIGLAGLLAGCGGVKSRVKQGKVETTINQAPNRSDYVEAIGIGASNPELATETQRKALARDAAIVKAQYEMLSMIKGVELDGGVTVDRAMEVDSKLEARLKETIKGAEILKSEFTADNGCVVTLRLPKKRLEDMMGVRFR